MYIQMKKTETLYQATSFDIKYPFPNLHPIYLMMDYEEALENLVKSVFPNIKLRLSFSLKSSHIQKGY